MRSIENNEHNYKHLSMFTDHKSSVECAQNVRQMISLHVHRVADACVCVRVHGTDEKEKEQLNASQLARVIVLSKESKVKTFTQN